MNTTYDQLNALPAAAFRNPINFITPFDTWHENVSKGYARKQYEKGRAISQNARAVYVSANGTWCAKMRDGTFVSSCEGIGYHACTADLLRGFLDGYAPLIVYRDTPEGIIETEVKRATD